MARDFDGDGLLDIAAISYFPDYRRKPVEPPFVLLRNKGKMEFDAFTMRESALGRWITMDAADLDGDGDTDIVLGAMNDGPGPDAVPQEIQEFWSKSSQPLLLLENEASLGP